MNGRWRNSWASAPKNFAEHRNDRGLASPHGNLIASAGGLARTTAGRLGATTYVVPALVVLMSWLLLDEVPGPLTLAGGALCLAGVAVSRSSARVPRSGDVSRALPGSRPGQAG